MTGVSWQVPDVVLLLSDRTVVVAGNVNGHIGFWDVDRLVEEDDGNGVDGVFEYSPHSGSVRGIVMHPATLHKGFPSRRRIWSLLLTDQLGAHHLKVEPNITLMQLIRSTLGMERQELFSGIQQIFTWPGHLGLAMMV